MRICSSASLIISIGLTSAAGIAYGQIDLKALLKQRRISQQQQDQQCRQFAAWANRLREEHPDLNLRRAGNGGNVPEHEIRAAKLFGDEDFIPLFGKPYDQLSDPELTAIEGAVVNPCLRQVRDSLAPLAYAFRPKTNSIVILFGFDRIVPRVVSLRRARLDLVALRSEAGRISGAEAADRLVEIERLTRAPFSLVWPSEAKSFQSAFLGAQQRVAESVLAQRLRPLLPVASGYEGARSLRDALARERRWIEGAAPAVREEYQRSVANRIAELLADVVTTERLQLSTFGSTSEALLRQAAWYAQFQKRYTQYLAHPVLKEFMVAFFRERGRLLTTLQGELVAIISKAQPDREIDKLMTDYFSLADDRATATFRELERLAAARKAGATQQKTLSSLQSGAQQATGPVRTAAGEVVTYVEPQFPRSFLRTGIQDNTSPSLGFSPARTICRFSTLIGADGSVREPELISGDDRLCIYGKAALVQWKYKRVNLAGKPVEVATEVSVEVAFRMQDINGRSYSIEEIRRAYLKRVDAALSNPKTIYAHQPIVFNDKDGRTYAAGFPNASRLGRGQGDLTNFMIFEFPWQQIQSYLETSGYYRLGTQFSKGTSGEEGNYIRDSMKSIQDAVRAQHAVWRFLQDNQPGGLDWIGLGKSADYFSVAHVDRAP